MIIGIGVDIVDVERFKWMLRRTPATLDRTLTPGETHGDGGRARSAESLAARFAAKEAVVKALGDVGELRPLDCEVQTAASGRPAMSWASPIDTCRWPMMAARRLPTSSPKGANERRLRFYDRPR